MSRPVLDLHLSAHRTCHIAVTTMIMLSLLQLHAQAELVNMAKKQPAHAGVLIASPMPMQQQHKTTCSQRLQCPSSSSMTGTALIRTPGCRPGPGQHGQEAAQRDPHHRGRSAPSALPHAAAHGAPACWHRGVLQTLKYLDQGVGLERHPMCDCMPMQCMPVSSSPAGTAGSWCPLTSQQRSD